MSLSLFTLSCMELVTEIDGLSYLDAHASSTCSVPHLPALGGNEGPGLSSVEQYRVVDPRGADSQGGAESGGGLKETVEEEGGGHRSRRQEL